MLYSIGKDLSVMRDLARKAYYREKRLFPSLRSDWITWMEERREKIEC